MKCLYFFLFFFWITFMTILLNQQTHVFAQWSNNPNINTRLCATSGDQGSPVMISDGQGGAIIFWSDRRNGTDADIYAQRVDSNGVIKWATDGVAIVSMVGNQSISTVSSDGTGGAILVWEDSRSGFSDIYAQRINGLGNVLWPVNGVAICTAPYYQSYPRIALVSGGAIIVWNDGRSSYPSPAQNIYAQKVNMNGDVQWAADGVSIVYAYYLGGASAIIDDDKGGVYISWSGRWGGYDLSHAYTTRIHSSGSVLWNIETGGGTLLPISGLGCYSVGVNASCLDSNGTILWSTPIGITGSYNYGPAVVPTSNGGVIVAWADNRSGESNFNIYAQRINALGNKLWATNGVVVCDERNNQYSGVAISSAMGGAIISWADYRNTWPNPSGIFAQRLDTNGLPQWTPNGDPVCISNGWSAPSGIVPRGNSGGAIIAWNDFRSGVSNIYMQGIGINGFPTNPKSTLISIQDIPNDQGGKVRIKWNGARDDVSSAGTPITQYGLWRKIPFGMSALGKRTLSPFMVDDSIALNYDFITSVPAMQSSQYNVVSPTLVDSTGTGTNWTKFIVTAHTSTPSVYYVSDVDSGYSIDNFPLPPPSNLIVNFYGNTARLSWNSIPPDTNLAYYSAYRLDMLSNCDSGWIRMKTTYDTALVDNNFDSTSTLAYRVSAVKRNGNESNSNEVPSGITTNFHSYAISSHWNIVSVPLVLSDIITTHIFPTAISDAFAYEGSYVTKSTLERGTGYWLKFNSNQAVCMHGNLITQDTITVVDGWNLIGSISEPVLVSSISSEPNGITTSDFFEYTSSYSITDTIQPGKGYWVKVNQACSLILSSSSTGLTKSSASHIRIVPTSELPPPPPDGKVTTIIEIPKQFALEQNYPNPFNPITVFRYQLPIGSKVTLRIYNLLGQEIKTLVDDWQDAGYKTVEWDASNFVSGVYFYRIQTGTFAQTKKLLLIR